MIQRGDSEIFGLFDQAMELEGEERERFLANLAQPETAEKIRQLIDQYDDNRSFFEKPLVPKFMHVLEGNQQEGSGTPDAFEGRRLGSYRLTRPLGQGGMGSVWLAVRDDGTHQREVAIKMLTRIHFKDFRRRFENEQQILAGLNHPNIASLYDSGITEDDIPFYVMQYVQGERLDVYANKNKLDLNARLRLFQKVCEAVNFAHQNLVVHRDLKPQNILVTEAGEPMLLDFGIAKALEADGHQTETGLRPMTREYASPEQILGKPINISSDIYSLGVILYELLTGSRPHKSDTGAPFDLERKILEEFPTRPSDFISKDKGEKRDPENNVPQYGYRKALVGDLDAISLMALEKEPRARYQSAQQLAEDIEAYLNDLPVRAKKATTVVLAYKFVKRHFWAVLTAFVVFAGLSVMLVITTAQKDIAKREKDNAEKMSKVLLDFISFSDPHSNDKGIISIAKLAEYGKKKVDEFIEKPEIAGVLILALSNLYRNSGKYDEALSLCNQALALLEGQEEKDYRQIVECYFYLGKIYKELLKYEESAVSFKKSLSLRKANLENDDLMLAKTYTALGLALLNLGSLKEATKFEEMANKIFVDSGTVNEDYGDNLLYLYYVHTRNLKYKEAWVFVEQSLQVFKQLGMREKEAQVYLQMGISLYAKGNSEKARISFEHSYEIFLQIYASDHKMLNNVVQYLISVNSGLGDDAAVEKLLERHGSENIINGLIGKGKNLFDKQELDGAWLYFKRALNLSKQASDMGSYYRAAYYMTIVERSLGDLYKSVYEFKELGSYIALNDLPAKFGFCRSQFHSFLEMGDLANAYKMYCDIYEDIATYRGVDKHYYQVLVMLAEFEMAIGNNEVAIVYLSEALNFFDTYYPDHVYFHISTKCLLAKAWQQNGDLEKAKELVTQVYDQIQIDSIVAVRLKLSTALLCAEIYFDANQKEIALEYSGAAVDLSMSLPWCHQRQAEAQYFILKSDHLNSENRKHEAMEYLEYALELLESVYGLDHSSVYKVREKVKNFS